MSSSDWPPALGLHFDQLCGEQTADAWSRLSRDLEALRGQAGARYPIVIEERFQAEIARRGELVARVTKQAHADFRHPLAQRSCERLVESAMRTFEQQADGLEGAFARELARTGFPFESRPAQFQHQRALSAAALANALRQHFWRLQNVPSMMPTPTPAPTPTLAAAGQAVNISGTVSIGNLAIAGGDASASGGSSRLSNDQATRDFADALERLARAVEASLDGQRKEELLEDIELARERVQRRGKPAMTLKVLSGVGVAIQSVAALQPAWEAVKAAGRALGLHL